MSLCQRDDFNDSEMTAGDAETDVVLKKRHPIDSLRVVLVMWTGVERQQVAHHRNIFGR